jgi:hypothetical protein
VLTPYPNNVYFLIFKGWSKHSLKAYLHVRFRGLILRHAAAFKYLRLKPAGLMQNLKYLRVNEPLGIAEVKKVFKFNFYKSGTCIIKLIEAVIVAVA